MCAGDCLLLSYMFVLLPVVNVCFRRSSTDKFQLVCLFSDNYLVFSWTKYKFTCCPEISFKSTIAIAVINVANRGISSPLRMTFVRLNKMKDSNDVQWGKVFLHPTLRKRQTTEWKSWLARRHQKRRQECSYTSYTTRDGASVAITVIQGPRWYLTWWWNLLQKTSTPNTETRQWELQLFRAYERLTMYMIGNIIVSTLIDPIVGQR